MKYEKGIYFGQLLGSRTGKLPSAKQTPFIGLNFQIVSVAVSGEWVTSEQSEKREVMLFLSEKAWPYTIEKLKTLGFNGDFSNPVFTETSATLECTINDKGYDEFDLHHEGGGECDPLGIDDVRVFNARFKSDSPQQAPPSQQSPPPQAQPKAGLPPQSVPEYQAPEQDNPLAGEDIPF